MTNWKTFVTAGISALASLIIFLQFGNYVHFPNWLLGITAFAQVGGLAAFGIVAKDYNVTGGTVGQPSTSVALAEANQATSTMNPPKQ
jgi:hypothetical protein